MIQWCEQTRLWWPSYDHQDKPHAHRFMLNRLTDSDLAVARCRKRQLCVQAGGMIGLWPQRLARSFEKVLTFEPDAACLAALHRNVTGTNVTALGNALGAAAGTAIMRRGTSAGSWRIREDGDQSVEVITIDRLDLQACDAIILDVEGSEQAVLQGAARTIAKFHPVLMVEEWDADQSESFMRSIGYRNVGRVHRDGIYVSVQ